jgi:cytochrome c biogenesis protein CcdA
MSLSLISLSALAGLVTILSPCILPILPILLGRSLRSHPFGPLALVGGLALSFAVMGSLLGFSAQILGPLSYGLRQVAILLLLLLGLGSIFPAIAYTVSGWITAFPLFRARSQPAISQRTPSLSAEFLVGTQLGLVWIPCAGPVLASILTLVVVEKATVPGFLALLAYALGAGIPMLLIAYSSQWLIGHLRGITPYMGLVQRIAGVCITLAAVGILLGWDQQIQIWLAPLFPQPLL